MPECLNCKTEIVWLKYQKNDITLPIEVLPNSDGKLVISLEKGLYRYATKDELESAKKEGKKVYASHYLRCKLRQILQGK